MAKVFGIGLTEGGHVTLGACMRQLGYRHADHDPDLVRKVLEKGDICALDEASGRYDSYAGMPWSAYYRRLDRNFPDARFVLEVSDSSHSWFGSLRRYAVHAAGSVREHVYGFSSPAENGRLESTDRHARQVQEYFAGRPERLLVVYWPEERSWHRLCEFLGEPVPQQPLPFERERRAARISAYLRRLRNSLQSYAGRVFPGEPY
ncbi:MAG TPA: sulfotransferase [Trueperaceae bacterium]